MSKKFQEYCGKLLNGHVFPTCVGQGITFPGQTEKSVTTKPNYITETETTTTSTRKPNYSTTNSAISHIPIQNLSLIGATVLFYLLK